MRWPNTLGELFKIKDFLGELFSYFMLEVAIIGNLAKINPYDQPAVEEMKLLTKKNF